MSPSPGRLLFALIVALAVACGGKSHAPTGVAPASAVASSDSAVKSGPFHAVFDAFIAIHQNYYREPDDAGLLSAAWSGARGLYVSRIGPIAGSVGPIYVEGLAEQEEALARALSQLGELAGDQLSSDDITFAAIDAMAASLHDDHTFYLHPDAWDRYQKGETIGFGYSTVRRGDYLLVWYVYPFGAAARAGVQPGDLVESVDGMLFSSQNSQVIAAGQDVTLGIDRPGVGEISIEATAEKYVRPIIESRVADGIGYMRVYRFPNPNQLPQGQTFSSLLDDTFRDLKDQGATKWIVDLRSDPGGAETAAASLAGRLGYKGTFIENRGRAANSRNVASGESAIDGQPLVVLINEGSASSAEIVANSLSEANLAYLVGAKSSGVVNTSHSYPAGGGAIFVTTDHIFAGPNGRYIDGAGVYPDHTVSIDRWALAEGHDSQLDWAIGYLKSKEDALGSR